MICQRLCQTLIKGGVLHIDHHTVDAIRGNLFRQAMSFILRRHGRHGDVPCSIRQQDDQWLHVRVQDVLALQGLLRHVQPG